MSSSKIYGDECESSESGWTMYIVSSIDDDSRNKNYDDRSSSGQRNPVVINDEDVDTDDSMASDASSGPGQQIVKTEQRNYNISNKKYKKSLGKKKGGHEEKQKVDEKEAIVNDKRGVVATLQSRNSAWFRGKKK
uniref:protein SOB FIVE-LIKE 1-like n=1 Tax=Erigeron canadensis TaxID=72917 RepID=UPI001CB8EF0A|nr:protein SOB FIVE-LIKE 1-like [Erigeron canadensis]XP_043608692.1 protein SOB FIVE-LIKE 1-like [Erigeron canadensis]XP_043608693.1 protein SOB FIVE-LIKE 1-like [Erigeron canadensis]